MVPDCDLRANERSERTPTAWAAISESFFETEVVLAAVFGEWATYESTEPHPPIVPPELRGKLITDPAEVIRILSAYRPMLGTYGNSDGYHFTVWTTHAVYFTTGPADGCIDIESVPRIPTAFEPKGGWPGDRGAWPADDEARPCLRNREEPASF
jgi:hypothetical protein